MQETAQQYKKDVCNCLQRETNQRLVNQKVARQWEQPGRSFALRGRWRRKRGTGPRRERGRSPAPPLGRSRRTRQCWSSRRPRPSYSAEPIQMPGSPRRRAPSPCPASRDAVAVVHWPCARRQTRRRAYGGARCKAATQSSSAAPPTSEVSARSARMRSRPLPPSAVRWKLWRTRCGPRSASPCFPSLSAVVPAGCARTAAAASSGSCWCCCCCCCCCSWHARLCSGQCFLWHTVPQ
jgi:hypothetical protein